MRKLKLLVQVSVDGLNLIDEFQLSVQPIIVGKGLQLFENINNSILFKN
jgi:dihydrofolate reductase